MSTNPISTNREKAAKLSPKRRVLEAQEKRVEDHYPFRRWHQFAARQGAQWPPLRHFLRQEPLPPARSLPPWTNDLKIAETGMTYKYLKMVLAMSITLKARDSTVNNQD